MQPKQMSISNSGNHSSRRWALALIPLAAALVLAPASKLFAGTTALAPESRPQAVSPQPTFGHIADADRDVGPGSAESILAQHP